MKVTVSAAALLCMAVVCAFPQALPEEVDAFKEAIRHLPKAEQVDQLISKARYYASLDIPLALSFAREASRIAERSGDPDLQAEALYYRGLLSYRTGNYRQGKEDMLESYQLAQEQDNYTFQALNEFGLAAIAKATGDLQEWEHMIRRSYRTATNYLDIDEPYGRISPALPAALFSNLAVSLFELGDIEIAEEITLSLLENIQRYDDDGNFHPWNLLLLGDIRTAQERFPEARRLYDQAYRLYQQNELPYGQMLVNHSRARMELAAGNNEEAIEYINNALYLTRQLNLPEETLNAYRTAAMIYDESGQYEKATDAYKTIVAMERDRFQRNIKYQVEAAQIKTELMQKENELLRQRSAAQQRELAYNAGMLTTVLAALVIALILGGIVLVISHQRKVARNQLRNSLNELEQANQELEIFNYSVSHDLRSPINNIIGYGEMLRDQLAAGKTEAVERTASRISQNATKAMSLINDILQLSRSSSAEMNRRKIKLGPLVDVIITNLRHSYPDTPINLNRDQGLEANADEGFISILLENLLGNAVKYAQEKDTVEISIIADETDQGTVYCVADNGIGFSQDKTTKIFDAFVRLENASRYPGTGIGLATAKRIVERHGGEIWAESAPGQGTRIYFTLG